MATFYVSENKDHYTVLRDGVLIRLPKAAISDGNRDLVLGLPKISDSPEGDAAYRPDDAPAAEAAPTPTAPSQFQPFAPGTALPTVPSLTPPEARQPQAINMQGDPSVPPLDPNIAASAPKLDVPVQPQGLPSIAPSLVAGTLSEMEPNRLGGGTGGGMAGVPDLSGYLGALASERKDTLAAGEAESAKSIALGKEYAGQQEKLAALANSDAAALAEQRMAISKFAQDYETKAADIAKLQVDPNRWWHQKSTGGKVLAAVAVGLGAAGASLSHSRNYAADMIESAIERDIDSQKAAIVNARAGLADKSTVYGMFRDAYQRDDVARAASQAFYLKQSELAILQKSSELDSPIIKAKARFLADQLREKGEEAMLNMSAKMVAAAGGNADMVKLYVPHTISTTTRGPGLAQSADDAAKLRQLMASVTALRNLAKDQQGLIDTYGTEFIDRRAKAQAASNEAQMLLQIKNMEDLGARGLQGAELELLKSLVPTNVLGMGFKRVKIEAFLKAINDVTRDRLSAYDLMEPEGAISAPVVQPAGAEGAQ